MCKKEHIKLVQIKTEFWIEILLANIIFLIFSYNSNFDGHMLIILSIRLIMKSEIIFPFSFYYPDPLMIRQLGGNSRIKINN